MLPAAAKSSQSAPSFWSPAWSHDGKRIALVGRTGPESSGLFVMNATGRGLRQITVGSTIVYSPTWSPDDKWLAFSMCTPDPRGVEPCIPGIWVKFLPSFTALRVAEWGLDPAWSPGGRKIAYTALADASWISVVAPDGKARRRVTADDRQNTYTDPSWSPGGKRLVFVTGLLPDGGPGGPGLGIVSDYGGRIELLLQDRSPSQPAWSPTRDEIAFVDPIGPTPHIFVLEREGGRVVHLARGSTPAWAPDGGRIAFTRDRCVYVINRDGSGVRRLTP